MTFHIGETVRTTYLGGWLSDGVKHPGPATLQKVVIDAVEIKDGVTFLGFKEWPDQRYEAKRFQVVPMNRQEAIRRLREIQANPDKEQAHGAADGVLCDLLKSLGYASVVDEYHKVDKWFA